MRGRGNVGINQRSAAHGGAADYGHVSPEAPVHPSLLALRLIIVIEPVFSTLAGVVLHIPAASALQDEHAHSFFRQAAGRDGSAESAAYDQYVKVVGHKVTFLAHTRAGAPVRLMNSQTICSGVIGMAVGCTPRAS